MFLKAHLLQEDVTPVFQVVVSFKMQDEGGGEQEYEASVLVEDECFEHSGTHPHGGERLKFWHRDAPAILRVADVAPAADRTSIVYALPGDEWVDASRDWARTPLLVQQSQAAFVKHLGSFGFEVKPKQ